MITVKTPVSIAMFDSLETRFGLRVSARLTEGSRAVGGDVSERLRFAREQALERARSVRSVELPVQMGATSAGAALLGRLRSGWGMRVAAMLPMFALVGGLVLIQHWQDRTHIAVAAEIDAALLADDLPPNAYGDVGFVEFLKTPHE